MIMLLHRRLLVVLQSPLLTHRRCLSTEGKKHRGLLWKDYQSKLRSCDIKPDPIQCAVISKLDTLLTSIVQYKKTSTTDAANNTSSSFFNLFSTNSKKSTTTAAPPDGMYLYGGVGCGKTFLMDWFYETISDEQHNSSSSSLVPPIRKRRLHFHKLLLEVHSRLYTLSKFAPNESDKLSHVVREIASELDVMCLDEVQVTDVGDAVIVASLFQKLIDSGIIIVATSNRHPNDLYKNGIQRQLFLPFISLVKNHCNLYHLDSGVDYRRLSSSEEERHKVFNFDWKKKFKNLVNGKSITYSPLRLKLSGNRTLALKAGTIDSSRVCHVSFSNLCVKNNHGVGDYIALALAFNTVFITDIPHNLNPLIDGNTLKRFTSLVDVLYENKLRVYFHSPIVASPSDIVLKTDVMSDEVFSFDRTVSRMIEMMHSAEYDLSSKKEREKTNSDDAFVLYTMEDVGVILQNHGESNKLRVSKALLSDICYMKNQHYDVSEAAVDRVSKLSLFQPSVLVLSIDEFNKEFKKFGLDIKRPETEECSTT